MRQSPLSPSIVRGRIRLAARIARSRRKLLDATDGCQSFVFYRSWGNLGDELIYAGFRRAFRSRAFEEISLRDEPTQSGDLAVIAGGGAWCGPYHEVLPRRLREIESRFERVVVLPSSFDLTVPEVRDTLAKTSALVFAREHVSWRAIRDVCQAELALDTAFFFDFSPFELVGTGLLEAFRSDAEATHRTHLPERNSDISVTASSLDQWLWTIARHQRVYTDRAHVMIAAALMGKEVRYVPSSYHKVPAIADWCLSGLDVEELEHT